MRRRTSCPVGRYRSQSNHSANNSRVSLALANVRSAAIKKSRGIQRNPTTTKAPEKEERERGSAIGTGSAVIFPVMRSFPAGRIDRVELFQLFDELIRVVKCHAGAKRVRNGTPLECTPSFFFFFSILAFHR